MERSVDDPLPEPRRHYIVRHWRGELSLATSLWVNEMLLGVLSLPIFLLLYWLLVRYPLSPKALVAVLIPLLCITLAVAIWQAVGVRRSAKRHKAQGGKVYWVTLVRMLVLAVLLVSGRELLLGFYPALKSLAQMVSSPDSLPAHRISLLSEHEVEIAGALSPGSLSTFEQLLRANPQLTTVQLDSPGGLLGEARAIALRIKENGFTTYTNAECSSACTLLFLAGKQRLLGHQGRLGFHSPNLYGSDTAPQFMRAMYRQAFDEHGVSAAFSDKMLSTPPSAMWYPQSEQLLHERIVTAVVDPGRFSDGRLLRLKHPGQLDSFLQGNFVFRTLAQADPERYQAIKTEAAKALNEASSFAQFSGLTGRESSILVTQALDMAPAAPTLAFWHAQVALMQALQEHAPEQCKNYILGTLPAGFSYAEAVPATVLQQIQEAQRGVIEAAAQNPSDATASLLKANLDALFIQAQASMPAARELFVKPRQHADQPDALCRAHLLLYRLALALPDQQQAASAVAQLRAYPR